MSAAATVRPFVTQLRTPRGQVLAVGEPGGDRIVIRVQYEALWDAVAMDVRSDTPVHVVARAMLDRFGEHADLSAFVVKVRGWEVRDVGATLAEAGVRSGTTVHVAHRYRRPVR
jgi:hypothetical protein